MKKQKINKIEEVNLNDVLMDVYNSGWLQRECKKLITKDEMLRDDFQQEISLIILQFKPAGKLQESYLKGEHEAFIKKIMLNQFNSDSSDFYLKYIKPQGYSLFENEDVAEDEEND